MRRTITEADRERAHMRAYGYLATRAMATGHVVDLAAYHAGLESPTRDDIVSGRMFATAAARRMRSDALQAVRDRADGQWTRFGRPAGRHEGAYRARTESTRGRHRRG